MRSYNAPKLLARKIAEFGRSWQMGKPSQWLEPYYDSNIPCRQTPELGRFTQSKILGKRAERVAGIAWLSAA